MYFWGNYSFQQPQVSFKDDREPALKFPVRMPLAKITTPNNPLTNKQAETESLVHQVEPSVTIKSISCAPKFALLVSSEGELYGLGHNHATFMPLTRHSPRYLPSWKRIHFRGRAKPVEVSCGLLHVMVRTADGIVYSVGDNTLGQLGHQSSRSNMAPTQPKDADFVELALGGVTQIVASHNSSFALTMEGAVYSWGYSGSGHLGHGDKGEVIDPQTGLEVSQPVTSPKLIAWFRDKRVKIVQIAVGKEHLVARSETDVYTCGEASFGRLGVGETETRCIPSRVEFPYRRTPEKLLQIAAGEAHTIVLKMCPETGSVVYLFGRYTSTEGQFTPIVQDGIPPNVKSVFGGAGTCSMLVTDEGKLMVWGQSSGNCSNGRLAGHSKHQPGPIEVLENMFVEQCVQSGQFWLVVTDDRRFHQTNNNKVADSLAVAEKEGNAEAAATVAETPSSLWSPNEHLYDVVVPLDRRVGRSNSSVEAVDRYDEAMAAFYTKYFGGDRDSAQRYMDHMPKPPPPEVVKTVVAKKGAHQLQVGDKVRLWMTDVYALAVVEAIVPKRSSSVSRVLSPGTSSGSLQTQPLTPPSFLRAPSEAAEVTEPVTVRLEWARDDWYGEDVALYSDDETLDEGNPNRWQSLWFVEPPLDDGNV